jgi:hypothetical protein
VSAPAGLRPLSTRPFPFLPGGAPACAAAGGLLHVLARDDARGAVRHVALGEDGGAHGAVAELPLAWVHGAAACGDGLLVCGADAAGAPRLLSLASGGKVRGNEAIDAGGELATWPRVFCVDGRSTVAWTTEGGARLDVAGADHGGLSAVRRIPLGEASRESDVVAGGGTVALVRTRASDGGLEVFLVEGDEARRTRIDAAAPQAPAVVPLGGALVVAWIAGAGREVRACRIDAEGSAGDAVQLAAAPGDALVRGFLLFPRAGGESALVLSAVTPGDGAREAGGDGRMHPRGRVDALGESVALVDAGLRAGPAAKVEPAGIALTAGGWAGGTLLVLTVAAEATVHPFRAGGASTGGRA